MATRILGRNTFTVSPGRTGFSKAASLYPFKPALIFPITSSYKIQVLTLPPALPPLPGPMQDRSGSSPWALFPIFLLANGTSVLMQRDVLRVYATAYKVHWFNTTAGNVNANITYKASPRFTITSNGGYFVPLRMPNTTFPDNYFYGFNFAYKVFKQKLTITASVTNFFEEKRKLSFLTENDFFITENMTYHTLPEFWTGAEL